MRPAVWARFQGAARVLVLPAVAAVLSIALWRRETFFGFGLTLVVAMCTLALAAVAERRPIPGARNRAVFHLAIWSYSIYLTHNLAFLAGSRVSGRFAGVPAILHVLAWLAVAVATGWIFFRAIELPAIRWRDRWVPRGRGAGGAVDASEALRGPSGDTGDHRAAD
jgi:peptidoglycan/LPS O-acetylase OafA/YrhL